LEKYYEKFIVCFSFFFALSLYAQEPSIKFYLNDGSFKSYLIADIDSLSVSKSESKYVMHIYYQDTKIAFYPNEIIQSVKIEKDTSRQLYLNVYIFGYPKPYLVFDIDSIIFKIDKWQPLTIGTQVWMLKNLIVDNYRNGDSIPEVRDNAVWTNLKTGAWCYYDNSDSIGKIYGKLYNWYAVDDSRGLAPEGWHVPSDGEWKEMEMYLGMTQTEVDIYEWRGTNEGGKLKEAGTLHWATPNRGASNESGFSALPGGVRSSYYGKFYLVEGNGGWWSATEYNATVAWHRGLHYYHLNIYRHDNDKVYGFSVRCIKDDK
jgi:uncharacterized protein (TIGR02145 family)